MKKKYTLLKLTEKFNCTLNVSLFALIIENIFNTFNFVFFRAVFPNYDSITMTANITPSCKGAFKMSHFSAIKALKVPLNLVYFSNQLEHNIS